MFAISLQRKDFRENDEAISFYTKEQGKVEAIARGVKKMVSKNTSSLEPFSLLEIELVRGKETTYVTKAVILEDFSKIRESLDSILMGNLILSNLDNATKPDQKDERIFALTYSFLKALNEVRGPSKLLGPSFVMRLWSELGFAPDLSGCKKCKNQASEEFYFDVSHGSIVCAKCDRSGSKPITISAHCLKILQIMVEGSPEEVQKVSAEKNEIMNIQKLVTAFVEYHGNYRVNWGEKLLRDKRDETDLRRSK